MRGSVEMKMMRAKKQLTPYCRRLERIRVAMKRHASERLANLSGLEVNVVVKFKLGEIPLLSQELDALDEAIQSLRGRH
jgi:hypothetical protein